MPALSTDIAAHFRPKPCPSSLADFLKPNTPMVHVHVTTFEDATLIGLVAPHIMFDVIGAKAFLSAWTAVLRGEAESVAVIPLDFAPLSKESTRKALVDSGAAARVANDEPVRGFFALGIWSTLLFVVSLVWRLAKDTQEVELLVRVPRKWLQAQKEEVTEQLQQRGSKEWVSSSDVLLAWLFRVSLSRAEEWRDSVASRRSTRTARMPRQSRSILL